MKKFLVALLLAIGIAPAFAQAPPPVPALPDSARLTIYTLSGSTCACAVNFAIYGDGSDVDQWVQVWINNVRYLSTDPTFGWSLSSPSGSFAAIPRPITDAILTFNNPITATVDIYGARRPRRTSQFQEGRGVTARDLNQVLTDIIAQNREVWDYVHSQAAGNANTLAKIFGTLTPGHCIAADGNGNLIDQGGACVGSASGVTAATQGQFAYYASNGAVVAGNSHLTIDGSNNLTQASGYAILGDFNAGSPTYPPLGDQQGLAVGWNFSGGAGEVDFFNRNTGATADVYRWYQQTGASAATKLMSLISSGGLRLFPKAVTSVPADGGPSGLWIQQAGTSTVADANSFPYNKIDIVGDAAAITPPSVASGFAVEHHFGGASATGGRTGLSSDLFLQSATNPTNANTNYVALGSTMHCDSSDNGTNTGAGARGSCFGAGINAQLTTGATNIFELAGGEVDVIFSTPGTVSYAWGWNVVKSNNGVGAVFDSAFVVGGHWMKGLTFTDANGGFMDSAATLVGTDLVAAGPNAAAVGIDFSHFTFSTAAWKGDFTLSGHFGPKSGPAPTANSCAGFSLSPGSSDVAGRVNYTSATSCSITFGTTYTNAPFCTVTPGTAASTSIVNTVTTGFSATFGTAQTVLYYNCTGV